MVSLHEELWENSIGCLSFLASHEAAIQSVGCSCSILGVHLEEDLLLSSYHLWLSEVVRFSCLLPRVLCPQTCDTLEGYMQLKLGSPSQLHFAHWLWMCSFIPPTLGSASTSPGAPCTKSGTRASPIHWAPWIFSSASHWRDQTCGVFIHPLLPLTCRNEFTSKMQYAWLNGGQQRWHEACTD